MSIMNNSKEEIAEKLNISEYINDMYYELITNINDKLKLDIDIEEDLSNELSLFWSKICDLSNELNNLRGNENYNTNC